MRHVGAPSPRPLGRAARAPEDLVPAVDESSHYYRQHWYWWGEAQYRTQGGKLELTSIPEEEWPIVEQAAIEFWDEIAQQSPRSAKVVQILKDYLATQEAAGPPYRYR